MSQGECPEEKFSFEQKQIVAKEKVYGDEKNYF
jgi:hypothetical protein